MYYRTIRNDIVKSKVITLTTLLFIAAAAMLVSLAAILIVNLTGSIDTLMTKAKTPHFMQMHAGEIDLERLTAFANQNDNVEEFQVIHFLNINGNHFVFQEDSLADSVQDNGVSVQSEKFDFLLDLDNNLITVSDGEIYVPIPYMQTGIAKIGEKVDISGKEFTIAGFIRDSQMNSLLSSSKRFLVSENDYAELFDSGSVEYLIEFRLKDISQLNVFETAYTSVGLEANGPTITYPLFKMINAISDGLMIAVILLISILVVSIAFLCIRFTLLAKIEEDYREIGVMKAIGLRISDIKKIYLVKYAFIAVIGSLLGFALSFLFRGILLENIRLYMGESQNASSALYFGIVGVFLVFLVIIAYVNSVLKRFRQISPAEAIRFGISQEQHSSVKRFNLYNNKLFEPNVFLGIRDVLSRKKIYATMLFVLVISAFIIIVPQNLHNTISSKNFITYMGVGDCDLRIDIQQTDHISEKATDIANFLKQDLSVSKFVVLTTKTFSARLDDGSLERIKIELGDHSIFPLTYSHGKAPAAENEIALSVILSKEMGKQVGDTLIVLIDGKEKTLTVSGVYSDVTNGGKTAKAVFSDPSADVVWSVVNLDLSDPALVQTKVAEFADRFVYAKVSGIDDFIIQTYGSTISSIGKASNAAAGIAVVITIMITLLFMRMLVMKDRYAIAVMKAFGFTNTDIRQQFLARAVFTLGVGIILGTLLANTLGEVLVGLVIASFGASSFEFVINPVTTYVLSPLTMILSVLVATYIGTMDVGKIKISENIKE